MQARSFWIFFLSSQSGVIPESRTEEVQTMRAAYAARSIWMQRETKKGQSLWFLIPHSASSNKHQNQYLYKINLSLWFDVNIIIIMMVTITYRGDGAWKKVPLDSWDWTLWPSTSPSSRQGKIHHTCTCVQDTWLKLHTALLIKILLLLPYFFVHFTAAQWFWH